MSNVGAAGSINSGAIAAGTAKVASKANDLTDEVIKTAITVAGAVAGGAAFGIPGSIAGAALATAAAEAIEKFSPIEGEKDDFSDIALYAGLAATTASFLEIPFAPALQTVGLGLLAGGTVSAAFNKIFGD